MESRSRFSSHQEDKAMTLYLRDIQKIPTVPEEEKGEE